LNEIKDDKVMAFCKCPSITTDEITYHIPKTVQEPTRRQVMLFAAIPKVDATTDSEKYQDGLPYPF
jgi:hypothetical protein